MEGDFIMKEKKTIKIRTDMYDDTKFKIIDTMPERDTINYIWTRVLTLCGKINDVEGRLYLSKNMPYTIEILALEFNRTKEQVENAMKVFNDLNMVCVDEHGVFKVCNWNKHQGGNKKSSNKNETNKIVKSDDNSKEIKEDINNKEILVNHDKSKDESKNNKSEINILDISNNNLVNDKNKEKKDNKKEKNTKAKGNCIEDNSESILTYDGDNPDEEVIYFDDSGAMPEGKPIAIFRYA